MRRRLRAFRHARAGLKQFAIVERTGWFHGAAAAIVVIAAITFRLAADEWRWVIFGIGLVWIVELINTAIEHLADAVTIEHSPHIRWAKDVASAAVLAAAVTAVAIALTIFVPRILTLFA